MISEQEIARRWELLGPLLDERTRRLWAAAESAAMGRGGVSLVARASGVSRRAIAEGLSELRQKPDAKRTFRGSQDRSRVPVRKKGGGRKPQAR